jgi:ABC transport system ATP-binding/permease protein
MKEAVLNALLQLFAIIANVSEDGVSFKARAIVKTFLRQYLKTNLINKYLVVFEHYLEIHHPHLFGGGTTPQKQTLSDSEKLRVIAEEINRSLLQREKFIVFLRLVEFINEDDVMTARELAFIRTIADSFNISRAEHDNTKSFVLNACDAIEKERIMAIDSTKLPFVEGIRHIRQKELEGRIAILHHASTDTFVFRYLGNMSLFLNGQPILPERIEILEHGSLITGPLISPIYYSDISRKFHSTKKLTKINFVAKGIEYRFKNSTKGIRKFSFSEESGNLIGIMGGSGAGKSTLLNILCGKLKPRDGRITINGYDIHKEDSEIEGVIGFVPQDDLLLEELTVFTNLYLNAKLCLGNLSETELLRRVNDVLTDLDLVDIKHLKVGNPLNKLISGGQRKRLNIALELIREPAVLFVDEPTSGLSSVGSEKVMLLLKEQALKGKLVIVNIHQPHSDIYKLFDRFLVLDKEGHVIYKGHPIDAITYFKELSNYVNADVGHCESCGNVMPEQILKMVEAKQVDEYGKVTGERKVSPEEWYDIYLDRIESRQKIKIKKRPLPDRDFYIPNRFRQFAIFLRRNLLTKLANRQYLLITFLEAPLLALVASWFTRYKVDQAAASYVFRDNVNLPVYMFMGIIVSMFMGLLVSAQEILRDRKILERESFLHLSRLSYLQSKVVVLFLISAIQTFSFVVVGNTILEIKGMMFHYWALFFTVSCLANMMGLNISAGLNSVVNAIIVIPFIVVPQLLFSGAMIQFDKLNNVFESPAYVPVIGELMTARWAYEAVAVQQFKENRFTREFFNVDQEFYNLLYEEERVKLITMKLTDVWHRLGQDGVPENYESELKLVRNELADLSKQRIVTSYGDLSMLTPSGLNEAVYQMALDSLEKTKAVFIWQKNEAASRRERRRAKMVDQWGGERAYNEKKQRYTNKRLEDLLLNRNRPDWTIDWHNHIIRKVTPIYQLPQSRVGRAQFFAPSKRVGSQYFDTYWFNLLVIWLSAIAYYLFLQFDLLRKAVNWNRIRKLRKIP